MSATTTNEQHALQTYVSDMLAAERHIGKTFAKQRDDDKVQAIVEAGTLVRRLASSSEQRIATL